MFKDTKKELERLQQALWEEQEQEDLPEEEELLPEDTEDLFTDEELERLLGETTAAEPGPVVYRNQANNYGRQLPNYANGYRAANTDRTDVDLKQYSKEVEQASRGSLRGLAITALLLIMGILLVLLWWAVRFGGLL